MRSSAVSERSISRLGSGNHSTAFSSSGGTHSRTWTAETATGSAPLMVAGRVSLR